MGIRTEENKKAEVDDMRNGPKQVPTESSTFDDWRDHSLPEKTSTFKYQDSTEENIGNGESQKFHYEGNDLPEKM